MLFWRAVEVQAAQARHYPAVKRRLTLDVYAIHTGSARKGLGGQQKSQQIPLQSEMQPEFREIYRCKWIVVNKQKSKQSRQATTRRQKHNCILNLEAFDSVGEAGAAYRRYTWSHLAQLSKHS